MKYFAIAFVLLFSQSGLAAGVEGVKNRRAPASEETFKVHACEKIALQQAEKLLKFHYTDGLSTDESVNPTISDEVKRKASIKAPAGNGKFDVLEVTGFVYRAEYRMRFIFAQIKGMCALMGQEILELSNPY